MRRLELRAPFEEVFCQTPSYPLRLFLLKSSFTKIPFHELSFRSFTFSYRPFTGQYKFWSVLILSRYPDVPFDGFFCRGLSVPNVSPSWLPLPLASSSLGSASLAFPFLASLSLIFLISPFQVSPSMSISDVRFPGVTKSLFPFP